MDEKKHILYLDILRILAIIGVICIHSGLGKFFSWSNALFVMISGALWLNKKQIDWKKFYVKNMLHIMTAFAFWSVFYVFFHAVIFPKITGKYLTTKEALVMLLQGRYHLWFCYLIIGIYLGLPFWKKIAENNNLLLYFLAVAFVFSFLVPCIQNIPKIEWTTWITQIINWDWTEYVFYFMLGYFLHIFHFTKRHVLLITLFGIISFVCVVLEWGSSVGLLLQLNVVCFLFVLFQRIFKQQNKSMCHFIEKISSYCFGVYLVHDFFLTIFHILITYLGYSQESIGIHICQVMFALCLALFTVHLLRKVPYLGNRIT